jgi:hypothetical protein
LSGLTNCNNAVGTGQGGTKVKHLAWIAATLAIALLAAGTATATVPNGNGHVVTMGISCDGAEPQLIRLTRPLGKSAWIELLDQHYVVSGFGITVRFTPTGGAPVVLDSYFNTFGQKVGLGEPIVCQGTFSEAVDGGMLETTITGHTHYLPRSG